MQQDIIKPIIPPPSPPPPPPPPALAKAKSGKNSTARIISAKTAMGLYFIGHLFFVVQCFEFIWHFPFEFFLAAPPGLTVTNIPDPKNPSLSASTTG